MALWVPARSNLPDSSHPLHRSFLLDVDPRQQPSSPRLPVAGRCGVSLDVGSSTISAAGGTGTGRIQTNRECSWSVPQLPPWVKLSQPVTPQGSAEIAFSVEENRSTSLRSWEVVVNDQRALISQEAAICTWSLSPANIAMGATGGEAQAVLKTEDFCSWELPRSCRLDHGHS